MKPYKETNNGNIVRRTFSSNIPESELVWHRDQEDRVVLPLNENDWMVQFDNKLPTKLTVGEEYFIPKDTFHRVIKGSGELQVEIIKTNFDEIIEEAEKKAKRDACYHKVKARYDVWPSAYACVPEKTSKALTKDGWKHVDELSVGDEIMTYNIEKDELEFKPILNLHKYKDVKTNVVKSGNNGFIFEATDNHKWVVKLPEIKGTRLQKYNRINDKTLIETSDLLKNKNNKHLVVSAQYNGGENIKLDKIFKYGDNWVKYILDITSEQRQAWLFSAIVYDGNQQKVERLTENTNNVDELNWLYTSPHGKQSFGFKQKDIEHRDAFLLSAFLNSGLVTWKKLKDKDIYSCHYSSNKNLKNTSNFKLVKENIADVWCPETENGTWVMMQETDGNGIITITGNSGALVKCRKVGASNWGNSSNEGEGPITEDEFMKNIAHINDIVTIKKSKEIYSLLLGMFPNAKEVIDYHFNDELGQPFAEFRRLIYEIDNYVLTGPKMVNPDLIELDDETINDRQAKYNQYIKDKEAGKPAQYFRGNNTDPRTIDFSKLPSITLIGIGGKYELVDGAHRIFLAKQAKKPLKAYVWVKQKNTHPNVIKIKNLFNQTNTNLDELKVYEAKKTDFSKEKSQGLHGWFSRKGGKGSSGWVDCNTCRKDPDTGRKKCKPCGRQDGEKRKYPACRPTPSSCGTRGKGKKWGKKSTSEGLNISEKFSIFDKNYLKMRLQETFNYEEPLVLPMEPKTKPNESPTIQPSRKNKPFLPERETQPDPKANV